MLCGNPAVLDTRHPERQRVRKVSTIPIRNNLLECCREREDAWASEVETRLQGCIDLVAAEAVYHDSCLSRFMLKRGYERKKLTGQVIANQSFTQLAQPTVVLHTGRHQDEGMLKWFNLLIEWLESESGAELYTLTEMHAKMVEFSDGADVYSIKRLKQKLKERYHEHIFFANVAGHDNVVCFRNMANYIINEKWHSTRKSTDDEAEWIVTTAAKIIIVEGGDF